MLKAWQHWSCGASPASPSPSWLSWATWSSCSRWMCWMRRMILRGGINTLKWCYSCAACVDFLYSMSVSGSSTFNKKFKVVFIIGVDSVRIMIFHKLKIQQVGLTLGLSSVAFPLHIFCSCYEMSSSNKDEELKIHELIFIRFYITWENDRRELISQ